jgi:hypothetical protein
MMTQREQKLRDYLLYQFALGLMSIIPLIIGALGLAEPIYPSIITVIYSYITIIYLIIFARKMIKEEFKKRFHI